MELPKLKAELTGLDPEEFERRLARLKGPDFGQVVAEEEYVSYRKAALRRELGYPEPKPVKYAVPILLAVLLGLVCLIALAGH
ncbi:hypothetical protein ACFY2K_26100 [Kitasatospora sp. NPDC001309]|uniref:hypothetical protein n=1 Tax=Kitasatospora sp. NPDC001309 TaxID=3364013 RepID=UPI0036AFC120